MWRRTGPLWVGMLLVVVSCAAGPPPDPVTIDVVATNLGTFEPTEATVKEGTEVTFNLTNEGATEHDIVVVTGTYGLESELRSALEADPDLRIDGSELIQGGESGDLVVTFEEPGQYQYFCSVLNHFASGMRGTITVEA